MTPPAPIEVEIVAEVVEAEEEVAEEAAEAEEEQVVDANDEALTSFLEEPLFGDDEDA